MDFVRLGERYTTSYTPDVLIEGYNSLIWTERHLEFGEFELQTFDVEGVKALLPEDTLVSHLETREVMVVETHEIAWVGEGADARPELTVRGRSARKILDERWVESTYQKKRRMRKKYSATSAACVLIYNAIDNASGADLTRGDDDPDTEGVVNHYAWPTKDVLPNVSVTETVPTEGGGLWYPLEQGILWPQLQKILLDADLGLRCIRPSSPSPGTVVTVRSALANRGEVVRTASTDITSLQFNVYSGTNRVDTVGFSLLQGHLESPQYLESRKDHRTALEVMSGEIEVKDVYRVGDADKTGWARKVMGYDAGSPEIPPEPQKPKELKKNATKQQREQRAEDMDKWIDKHARWENKRARIVADFREAQTKLALNELRRFRRVDMFSGVVSALSPHIYQVDYNLGDTVMLYGDYGKTAEMVVAEHVRTEDANGDRGIPGLVAP